MSDESREPTSWSAFLYVLCAAAGVWVQAVVFGRLCEAVRDGDQPFNVAGLLFGFLFLTLGTLYFGALAAVALFLVATAPRK